MSTTSKRSAVGHHRHKAESHLTEKRSAPQKVPEKRPRREVEEKEDGRLIARIQTVTSPITLTLAPGGNQNSKVLHLFHTYDGVLHLGGLGALDELIDALEQLGNAWVRQSQAKEASHGNE